MLILIIITMKKVNVLATEKNILRVHTKKIIMQHLQPNTTLQGGKYRKLRVSERLKNLFLDVRAEADYSIERVLG